MPEACVRLVLDPRPYLELFGHLNELSFRGQVSSLLNAQKLGFTPRNPGQTWQGINFEAWYKGWFL